MKKSIFLWVWIMILPLIYYAAEGVKAPIYTSHSAEVNVQDGMTGIILPSGTPVSIEVQQNVDGEYVNQGQPVTLRVKYDVKVEGETVIKAGAVAIGTIINVTPPKGWGRAGTLQIKPVSAMAVDGQQVLLAGQPLLLMGEVRLGLAITIAIIMGIILPFIGWVFGFTVKGKPAGIDSYTSLDTQVATDTEVDTW